MILKNIKNEDRAKYIISLVLDAIDINIEPNTGRIYYEYNASAPIVLNGKILRLDFGEIPPNNPNKYMIFNPILKEDHAHMLITLILQTLVYDEDDMDPDIDITGFEVRTSDGLNGIIKKEIIDSNGKVVADASHRNDGRALFLAGVAYIYSLGALSDKDLEEIIESVEIIDSQIEELENMSDGKRRKFLREQKEAKRKQNTVDPVYEDFSYHYRPGGNNNNMIDNNESKIEDAEYEIIEDEEFTDKDFEKEDEKIINDIMNGNFSDDDDFDYADFDLEEELNPLTAFWKIEREQENASKVEEEPQQFNDGISNSESNDDIDDMVNILKREVYHRW